MGNINYKGYILTATPRQLDNSHTWIPHVLIKKCLQSETLSFPFSAKETYDSQMMAEAAAFKFGINIIKGKVPGCSVEKK